MSRIVEVVNWSAPLPQPIIARWCAGFFCRLRGLMFRSHISVDEGLLLVQPHENRLDSSIHMFFVFTDLAVIWIDSNGVVVDTVLARKWHPAYFPKSAAKFILELSSEHINKFAIGDKTKFE
jgi:uncharacterized membrane protein (UPF0127 family)